MVVPMSSLDGQTDEALRRQSIQVRARRGRPHIGDQCELGTGARAAVQQAIEHAGSCRFADDGRNRRCHVVDRALNGHTHFEGTSTEKYRLPAGHDSSAVEQCRSTAVAQYIDAVPKLWNEAIE